MAALLTGAVALPLASCDRQVAEDDAPKVVETPTRKAGLWQQTTAIEGMPAIPPVTMCIDSDSDKKLAWWGQQGVRGGCRKNDVKKNPDGSWGFESVCESPGGMVTTTKGSATGDFQSGYRVTAESTTAGAPVPDMNGVRTVTIEASWQGACPAGMRPGDMKLPDGTLVNLLDITGG